MLCGRSTTSSFGGASGDGGDDGELVFFRDLSIGSVEVTDVLVTLVDVNGRVELVVAGVEMLFEIRVLLGEVPKTGAATQLENK
jgi:hypothetical protein